MALFTQGIVARRDRLSNARTGRLVEPVGVQAISDVQYHCRYRR
jgi:hypothetical protein